jgi:WD40 repeat protein
MREVMVEDVEAERDQGLSHIAFSPDGNSLVVESWREDQRGMPMYPRYTTIRFLELPTGRQLRSFVAPNDMGRRRTTFALSPEGSWLAAVGGNEQTVYLVDATTAKSRGTLGKYALSCAFSADGKKLAIGDYKDVRLFDVETRKALQLFNVSDGQETTRPGTVAIAPDGSLLVAVGDYNQPMHVWDTATGRLAFSVPWAGGERPNAVTFSPDGQNIVVAIGCAVRIYDVKSHTESVLPGVPRRRLNCAVFSPDGATLAVCGYGDRGARLYNVATRERIQQYAHGEKVRHLAFSPDGNTLATGGQTICIWNTADGKKTRTLQENLAPPRVTGTSISSVAFTDDGRHLVSGNLFGFLQVWNLANGDLVRSISQPVNNDDFRDPVKGVVVFPGGTRAATRTGDVHVWDLTTGELLKTYQASGSDGDPAGPLALSPDGRTLVFEKIFSVDREMIRKVVMQDVAGDQVTGDKAPRELKIGDNRLHRFSEISFAFSPDGRLLATCAADKTVRLWDVATANELQRFDGHIDRVSYVDFSPDGKSLASASWDGTVVFWDISNVALNPRQPHRQEVPRRRDPGSGGQK